MIGMEAVHILPQVLKEKWWFYVYDKDEDWLIWLCLKNGYLGWYSCMKGFQLSRDSEEKKTEEAQKETNGSQKHRTSVQVRK